MQRNPMESPDALTYLQMRCRKQASMQALRVLLGLLQRCQRLALVCLAQGGKCLCLPALMILPCKRSHPSRARRWPTSSPCAACSRLRAPGA